MLVRWREGCGSPGALVRPWPRARSEARVPARAVIVKFRAERHTRLRELAKAAGARDPERLADQLGIVLEGSGFCAEGSRPSGRASALVRAAETLIDAETPHS
jgi:hypothetical protein